jgi:hypothetical protein
MDRISKNFQDCETTTDFLTGEEPYMANQSLQKNTAVLNVPE